MYACLLIWSKVGPVISLSRFWYHTRRSTRESYAPSGSGVHYAHFLRAGMLRRRGVGHIGGHSYGHGLLGILARDVDTCSDTECQTRREEQRRCESRHGGLCDEGRHFSDILTLLSGKHSNF